MKKTDKTQLHRRKEDLNFVDFVPFPCNDVVLDRILVFSSYILKSISGNRVRKTNAKCGFPFLKTIAAFV